ncbi:MAG: DUF4097 family beta strand repeat-containing protein [Pyrinomonadaceae bacterium]
MKNALPLFLVLCLNLPPGAASAYDSTTPHRFVQDETSAEEQEKGGQTITTTASVLVTLCENGGAVTVRGWERNVVSVSNNENNRVRLRVVDGAGGSAPATKVEVLLSDSRSEGIAERASCNVSADIELNVPRGATIDVRTHSGDVQVAEVAEARIKTLSGRIDVRGASKGIDAKSTSGDIDIRESSGRVSLRTITGDIEATNAGATLASDAFEAETVSGEITLSRVTHTNVSATSVTGSLSMTGALARGGRYEFKSSTGDVVLNLPADASFRINARVTTAGTIITDFPVRYTGEQSAPSAQRLTGVYGSGDALLNLVSYNGTVHLRRN